MEKGPLRLGAKWGAVLGCALLAAPAYSATYDFYCLTWNDPGDCAIGESQLFVDVTDPGSDQVQFTFRNIGPDASSITDVYFDDGALLHIASLIDSDDGSGGHAGVDFSEDASPPDLPGRENADPDFEVTAGFLADSDPPVEPNGVHPGEWLGIVFDLQSGRTFNDVLIELGNGDLRIGIRVQGFSGGGSESFINNDAAVPPAIIPVPAAVWLFGSGLVGLVAVARRRTA